MSIFNPATSRVNTNIVNNRNILMEFGKFWQDHYIYLIIILRICNVGFAADGSSGQMSTGPTSLTSEVNLIASDVNILSSESESVMSSNVRRKRSQSLADIQVPPPIVGLMS